MAQLESGVFRPIYQRFRVSRCIKEIIELMADKAFAKDVKLKFILSKDLKKQSIYADRQRIQQIILNLVSNALKFTKNGSIAVEAKRSFTVTQEDKKSKKQIQKEFLNVSVKDTGVGISRKDLSKLFKNFGVLKSNAKLNPHGVGLGLSICK